MTRKTISGYNSVYGNFCRSRSFALAGTGSRSAPFEKLPFLSISIFFPAKKDYVMYKTTTGRFIYPPAVCGIRYL